jgi:FkbM family methyltransferase
MGSGNKIVEKSAWRDEFFGHEPVERGHCGQEEADQFLIPSDGNSVPKSTTVHCIEAMPQTYRRLKNTSEAVQFPGLVIHNAAMSSSDGSVRFPDTDGKVGVEGLGINVCGPRFNPALNPGVSCPEVPMHSLDTFVKEFVDFPAPGESTPNIDYLSIVVEGFDGEVLDGAKESLKRVRYVECEYNWKGPWGKRSLQSTIDTLFNDYGFVCYWPGVSGNVWRITQCFQPYYDLHFWSNVACVHPDRATHIFTLMEERFNQTVAAGSNIRYGEAISATDTAWSKPL